MSRIWRLLLAALLLLAACAPSASSTPGASDSPPASAEAPSGEPSASESAEPIDAETPPVGSVFFCNQAIDGPTVDPDTTSDGAVGIAIAHVADVRVGTHPGIGTDPGYDRIVFEFIEDGTPAFRVEPASPPFVQDPSGLPMTVNGSDFMQVILNGGTKVADDGSLTYTGPTEFEPGFTQLVHLIERGDFEAVNNWYVGMADWPNGCLRAFLLSDPSRIVIDLAH